MWELMYTSAPGGLKPGSRGFCTVAMTRGLGLNLVQRLESLSGYRPAYPPHDPRSRENPVNISYCDFRLGGEHYFVLSRLAFAGFDYTQRSNKIAHHVVLTADELPQEGPAWLALQEGVFETTWSGEPRLLPEREPARHSTRPLRPARHWQETVGDAGWAGILAERLLEEPPVPTVMLFQPGMPVIQLIDEAMALLPPEARWETNFSTYQTDVPAGITYQWRGLLPDSPLLGEVRRNRRLLVLDLTHSLERASGAHLVECARTGVDPWPRTDIPSEVGEPQAQPPVPSQPVGRPVRRPGSEAPSPRPIALGAKHEEPRGDPPQRDLKVPRHVLEKHRRRRGKRRLLILLSVAATAVLAILLWRLVLPEAGSPNGTKKHRQTMAQSLQPGPPPETLPGGDENPAVGSEESAPGVPKTQSSGDREKQPSEGAPSPPTPVEPQTGDETHPEVTDPKANVRQGAPAQVKTPGLRKLELGLWRYAQADFGEPIGSIVIEPEAPKRVTISIKKTLPLEYVISIHSKVQLDFSVEEIIIALDGGKIRLSEMIDRKKLGEEHHNQLVGLSRDVSKRFKLKGQEGENLGYLEFLDYNPTKAVEACRRAVKEELKAKETQLAEIQKELDPIRADLKEHWKMESRIRPLIRGRLNDKGSQAELSQALDLDMLLKLVGAKPDVHIPTECKLVSALRRDKIAWKSFSDFMEQLRNRRNLSAAKVLVLEQRQLDIVLLLVSLGHHLPKDIASLDYWMIKDWGEEKAKWKELDTTLDQLRGKPSDQQDALVLERGSKIVQDLITRRDEHEAKVIRQKELGLRKEQIKKEIETIKGKMEKRDENKGDVLDGVIAPQ